MASRINNIPNIGQVEPRTPGTAKAAPGKGDSFRSVLESRIRKAESVKFSAHAMRRLEKRNINVNPDMKARIDEAVHQARGKGAREALIVGDDAAFVVSIKNNVVITAMEKNELKDNIFTNIDSAVII